MAWWALHWSIVDRAPWAGEALNAGAVAGGAGVVACAAHREGDSRGQRNAGQVRASRFAVRVWYARLARRGADPLNAADCGCEGQVYGGLAVATDRRRVHGE
jgi:hypothetical protein